MRSGFKIVAASTGCQCKNLMLGRIWGSWKKLERLPRRQQVFWKRWGFHTTSSGHLEHWQCWRASALEGAQASFLQARNLGSQLNPFQFRKSWPYTGPWMTRVVTSLTGSLWGTCYTCSIQGRVSVTYWRYNLCSLMRTANTWSFRQSCTKGPGMQTQGPDSFQ